MRGLLTSCGMGVLAVLLYAALPSQPSAEEKRAGVLTGKEKLAGKATDEQRVNNCKVPSKKRGTKARPAACGVKDAANGQKLE